MLPVGLLLDCGARAGSGKAARAGAQSLAAERKAERAENRHLGAAESPDLRAGATAPQIAAPPPQASSRFDPRQQLSVYMLLVSRSYYRVRICRNSEFLGHKIEGPRFHVPTRPIPRFLTRLTHPRMSQERRP